MATKRVKNEEQGPIAQGLDSVIKDVEKLLGKDVYVEVDPSKLLESRPHIPTGSMVMDYLIGGRPNDFGVLPCPGLPKGGIVNIYGQESAGKTTLALTACAEVAKSEGGSVAYIDWENAIDLAYAQALGVPVKDSTKFALFQPKTLEQGIQIAYISAKRGVSLIVFDSVSAGVPQQQAEKPVSEQGDLGRIGLNAGVWSAKLPTLATEIAKSGSCIIGISQLRKKISMGPAQAGPDTQAQGGEAWKFYSWVRIRLAKIEAEKAQVYSGITNSYEDQVTAVKIKAKLDKCKVSPSQQHEQAFWIEFGKGIDNLRSAIDILCAHKVIIKKGAWYEWVRGGETVVRGQGYVKFLAGLDTIENGREILLDEAIQILRGGSYEYEATDESEIEEDLDLSSMMVNN
jgi:recombination protein RecA